MLLMQQPRECFCPDPGAVGLMPLLTFLQARGWLTVAPTQLVSVGWFSTTDGEKKRRSRLKIFAEEYNTGWGG